MICVFGGDTKQWNCVPRWVFKGQADTVTQRVVDARLDDALSGVCARLVFAIEPVSFQYFHVFVPCGSGLVLAKSVIIIVIFAMC